MKQNFIFILLSIITVIFPKISLAYDPFTTHPGITEQVVELFNLNNNVKINFLDKETIIQGAIDEDNPVWQALNHFYDPVQNIGINNNRTALTWATVPNNGNDFTWDENISKYAKGDREGALLGLGHILHLTEDMTVPDHTRNDPHIADGLAGANTGISVYEKWAKEHKTRVVMKGVGQAYFEQGLLPISMDSIEDYFNDLAIYSNNNYVSPDTIESSDYSLPVVVEKRNGYAYGKDTYFNDRHKLYIDDFSVLNGLGKIIVDKESDDFSVVEDYFNRLSKQAILSGAGIVQLFFTEAEAARTKYLDEEIVRTQEILTEAVLRSKNLLEGGTVSRFLYSLSYPVRDFVNNITSSILNTTSSIGLVIHNGGSSIINKSINTVKLVDYTNTKLANIGVQKIEDGILTATKVVVSTGQKVILYVQEKTALAPSLMGPAIAYNLPVAPSVSPLTSAEISKLISILSTPVNASIGESKQVILNLHRGSSGNNTEIVATSTATTTVDDVVEDTATTTATSTDNEDTSTSTATTTTIYEQVDSPIFTDYEDLMETTPTTTVSFFGTSIPGFIISYLNLINSETGTTTVDEEGDWYFDIENIDLSSTTIDFYAEPDDPNLSTSTFDIGLNATTTIYYIKSSPTTVDLFEEPYISEMTMNPVQNCVNSELSSTCLIIATSTQMILDFSWTSGLVDISYYTVSVNDQVLSTTSNSYLAINLDSSIYYEIKVTATDIYDYTSDSDLVSLYLHPLPLVINEVGWMGTIASGTDEWIELYNQSDYEINLENWTLATLDHGFSIDLIGTIPAQSFYLLERTDDNTISNISADYIYGDDSATFDMDNSGETLVLSFDDNSEDQTPLIIDGTWAAGTGLDTGDTISMERKNTVDNGSDVNNWASNNEQHQNGMDALGAWIDGTPKIANDWVRIFSM